MQRVRRIDASSGDVEEAFIHHHRRTAGGLFGGLEHEDHVAGSCVALGVQDLGRADKRCHMKVVTACVHLAGVGRDVVDVEQLLDRQRIHVTTQQHDRPWALAAAQDRGDRRQLLAQGDLEIESLERFQDQRLGLGEVTVELGHLVQLAPQRDQFIAVLRRPGPVWTSYLPSQPIGA